MNKIVEMALNARTVADVDALEKELRGAGAHRIRYLGDRPSNWSTLSNAADSKALLFERATNAFDSLLELEVQRQRPSLAALASPALAAQKLFNVPRAGVVELSASERERMARHARVVLMDSDNSRRRPTIAFRDFGTGVSRREAPQTVLSLEGTNKFSRAYQHGVYGKGGSLACIFCDATVFVMRKQPDLLAPGEKDEVTIAVVRKSDREDYRMPFFRYLVCDTLEDLGGLPWSCLATGATEFEPGLYVAHVNYQADGLGETNWRNEGSIYAYAETLLFRPTLPYGLVDDRTPPANQRPEGRGVSVLAGLAQRLEHLEVASGNVRGGEPGNTALLRKSEYSSVPVPGVGTARVRWWLFRDHDRRRSYAARSYVTVFTHDGQVHHCWDQQRFQTLVPSRRRVAERIFVEVDLEEVPRKRRMEFLSSVREALRKTPDARKLEDAIAVWLASDPDLEEEESRFTREALQRTTQRMTRNFLERLNRAIAAKVPTLEVLENRKGPRPKPKPTKRPEELLPEPTSFVGPAGVTVVRGDASVFYMEINAVDGFVPTRAQIELQDGPAGTRLALSVGDLRRGRVQLGVATDAETALGQHRALLVLSWLRGSGGMGQLRWPLSITVLAEHSEPKPRPERKDGAGRGEGKKRSLIALVWNRLDANRGSGWTEETAGDLQRLPGHVLAEENPELYGELKEVDVEVPTIVLNHDFAPWAQYARASAKSGDQAMDGRRDRYGIALGVAIANLWVREEALVKKHAAWQGKENGTDEPEAPMSEPQRRRALSEAARGVLAMLPEFDRLVSEVTEGVGS